MDNYITEQWKPVVGYEGLYEVSDHGRVRSVDRVVIGPRGFPRRAKGRILVPGTLKRGHLNVGLSRGGAKQMARVHRLVALAFLGPAPEGHVVCHRNSDPADNRAANLRWGTHKSNSGDMIAAGNSPRGVRHGRNVLTEEMVRDARERWVPHKVSIATLAEEYGVKADTLKKAVSSSGISWRWLD